MARPNIFVYRVLKAKYFPNVDPMNMQLRNNSFYLWQSLSAGQGIVQNGCFWRVGDGFSIDVWSDRLVRGLLNFSIPFVNGVQP